MAAWLYLPGWRSQGRVLETWSITLLASHHLTSSSTSLRYSDSSLSVIRATTEVSSANLYHKIDPVCLWMLLQSTMLTVIKILSSESICFGNEWKKHITYLHSSSSAINTKRWNCLKKNILLLPTTDSKIREQRIDRAHKQQISLFQSVCDKVFRSVSADWADWARVL